MHSAAPADAPGELDEIAHQLDAASRVVHLEARGAEPAETAAALLEAALGARATDPLFAFSAYLLHLRARSERLVVVIDDLDALPPQTAQWLRAALDQSGGSLLAVARTHDAESAERAAARFHLDLQHPPVALAAPMWRDAWPLLGSLGLLAVALGALALRLW